MLFTVCAFSLICTSAQAQGFWKSFGQGMLNGMNRASQQMRQNVRQQYSQQSTTSYSQYDNGSNLEKSGFVGASNFGRFYSFPDGSWFQGIMNNGKPSAGKLHYSDGTEYTGDFDGDGKYTGLGLLTWPNGMWYYGNFSNGYRHGEGSFYVDGKYYDIVSNVNEIVSSEEVSTPRYNKASHDDMIGRVNGINLESQADDSYSSSISSSSSSNTKSRGVFSNSDIKRQATREAKAYENYKKDPSITSGSYYQSQKKMTKLMQQHATGR